MLPGLTAEQWGRPLRPLSTVLLSLTAIGAAAYFLTGATAETVPPWLYVVFALAILNAAAVTFVVFAGLLKAIKESKAGYTTTGGAYPELPQFDSKTGDVLGEAGQREQPTNRRK
jgi:hypothetical protein